MVEENDLEFSYFGDVVNRALTCQHHYHIIGGSGALCQRAPFPSLPCS